MKKTYRKKPVTVEAVQFVKDSEGKTNIKEILDFIGEKDVSYTFGEGIVVIRTLEGETCASIDDYVIKGTAGEFYPCKSHIFEDVYEEVD